MSKTNPTGTETLFAFASIIVYIPAAAYVTTILWAWFIVPIFGLPLLSLAQAFGLTVFTVYFLSLDLRQRKDLGDDIYKIIGNAFIRLGAVVAVGWLATLFL